MVCLPAQRTTQSPPPPPSHQPLGLNSARNSSHSSQSPEQDPASPRPAALQAEAVGEQSHPTFKISALQRKTVKESVKGYCSGSGGKARTVPRALKCASLKGGTFKRAGGAKGSDDGIITTGTTGTAARMPGTNVGSQRALAVSRVVRTSSSCCTDLSRERLRQHPSRRPPAHATCHKPASQNPSAASHASAREQADRFVRGSDPESDQSESEAASQHAAEEHRNNTAGDFEKLQQSHRNTSEGETAQTGDQALAEAHEQLRLTAASGAAPSQGCDSQEAALPQRGPAPIEGRHYQRHEGSPMRLVINVEASFDTRSQASDASDSCSPASQPLSAANWPLNATPEGAAGWTVRHLIPRSPPAAPGLQKKSSTSSAQGRRLRCYFLPACLGLKIRQ